MKKRKIVSVSFVFYFLVYLTSCKQNSQTLLLNGESACWLYFPIKSEYPFDDYSGVCFYSNGKCFEYINRNGYKIPYGTFLDITILRESFNDWDTSSDTLFIGTRKYHMNKITTDSILITNRTDSIIMVVDTTNTIINWGSKADSISKEYL